jgi:pimeloyl-ACP methyl ester carboxylesterase
MEGGVILNAEYFPDPPRQWAPGLPVLPIPAVYLLHGKGGSPRGTVAKIEAVLSQHWPALEFVRPAMPHSDPAALAETSVDFLRSHEIPQNALVLGVSLGGVVAAKLQEVGRPDLQVIAISSPTWADGVRIETKVDRRLAFYSSTDEVIADRVAEWPKLTSYSRDLDWLTHDTDKHLKFIARLFDLYLEGRLPEWINDTRNAFFTNQEREERL